MKIKNILLIITVLAILTSCSTTVPYTATNNKIGSKTGTSETTCLFGFGGLSSGISFNKDYGIYDAAKDGKIEKIATVDLKIQNFVILKKHTLIVTGE